MHRLLATLVAAGVLGGLAASIGGPAAHTGPLPGAGPTVQPPLSERLADRVYYMPANFTLEGPVQHLPLQRWDIVFVGSIREDHGLGAARLIPGRFDHLLVYLGKDAHDRAYAAEVTVDDVRLQGLALSVTGGIRLRCLGLDYGTESPSPGERPLRHGDYGIRWARRLTPVALAQVRAHAGELLQRIERDIAEQLPYQLPLDVADPLLLATKTLRLVEDGLDNGAGCVDYWLSLFEEYAGVCVPGTRMAPDALVAYYRSDPQGRQARLPARLNPLEARSVPIGELFDQGFRVTAGRPHRFSCDGSEETGVSVPDLLLQSASLVEIPTATLAARQ